jgi:hypothetical protein
MPDARRGWQPDPYGLHEFRFFSDDGSATLLVRDGGTNSYDKPPADGLLVLTPIRADETFEQPPAPMEVPAPTRDVPSAAPEVLRSLREANPDSHMRGRAPLRPPDPARHPGPVISKPAKVAYIVVLAAMAVSGVALLAIHLGGKSHPDAAASTTTTTRAVTTTSAAPTTTVAIPSALQAEAATVGTESAVSSLFASHYTAGLVIDRGCSQAFSIVCTYGPPGGASPTDPVYQIHVAQAAAGWYVASVVIDN